MLIFLFGKDSYRIQEKVRSIKQKFLEKSSGSDLSSFDFAENPAIDNFGKALAAQGLFSAKKLILVSGALSISATVQKEILAKLEQNATLNESADTVVVFCENSDPKKNLSLFKYLLKNSKSEQLSLLDGIKLEKWAHSFLAKEFPLVKIDRAALLEILASTGSDLYRLSSELSKIAIYRREGAITLQDARLLLSQKPLSTIFQTIEALTSGNSALSLKLFHEQLSLGQDPLYLLSMYVYQLRTLLKVNDALAEGVRDPLIIAKIAQIHPFVAKKSALQLRAVSQEKLKQLYLDLAELDLRAKTGKIDPVLALDMLLSH